MRFIILLLLSVLPVSSATFTAADASVAAVSNAMVLCSPGDIVEIPNSSPTFWTNGLYITNRISIVGQSRTGVVISNAIPDTTPVNYRHLFNWDLRNHQGTSYFGNLTICQASEITNVFSTGTLVEGDNADGRRMCITNVFYNYAHPVLNGPVGFALTIESALGVVHGCQFNISGVAIYVYHRVWNGGDLGHGAWSTNDNFGTDQFWYIENCGFDFKQAGFVFTTVDGYAGTRYVGRYSNLTNTTFEGHGPESSAGRGTRAVELYMNNGWINGGAIGQIFSYVRSGPMLIWSNVCNGITGTSPFKMPYFRTYELASGWRAADGTNAWDKNTAGGPVATGTVTATNAVDARSAGVSVAGAPWSVDQHKGKFILRTSDFGANGNNFHSVIQSNSVNTLYYAIGQNGQLHFATSDTFSIYGIDVCLDQQGIGIGGTASGLTPWTSNTQAVSPCYEWNNVDGLGNNMGFEVPDTNPTVLENTHWFSDTAKPGYSPLIYPHPLVSGVPSPPVLPAGNRLNKLHKIRLAQ